MCVCTVTCLYVQESEIGGGGRKMCVCVRARACAHVHMRACVRIFHICIRDYVQLVRLIIRTCF